MPKDTYILEQAIFTAITSYYFTIFFINSLITFVTNIVAAAFFATSGEVVWSLVLVMAPASLVGGAIGGRLAGKINPLVLRAVVVICGFAVAVKLLLD